MKKQLTKSVLLSLAMGALTLGSAVGAQAAEEATFTLDEMVVTATRTPVEAFKAKANMSVVTKEDIQKKNYVDLYAVLRDVPGIQQTSYAQAGYFTSNGLRINGSNKVVVLIDGIRANQASEQYSTGMLSNMDNIERIEVLKGAASALYGADAQGGVINVITKKAGEGNSKVYFHAGNFSKQRYGVNVNAKTGKLGIKVGANKSKEGNFKAGNGQKIYSEGESNNWNVGLNYELKENSNIKFEYDNFNNHFSYISPGKPSGGNGKYDSTNARIVWNQEFDANTHNLLSIASNRKSYVPTWGPATYRSTVLQEQLSKNVGQHLITVGVDHETTKVIESTTAKYVGVSLKSTAGFIQDQIVFDDKWSLDLGLRYTNPDAFDAKWTPSIKLGHDFNASTNAYIGWTKFFNTPSMANLYSAKYGNENLKPENGKNFEIGINHKFSDKMTAAAHFFHRETNNMIQFNYDTYKYDNINNAKAKGFDIQFRNRFDEHFASNVGYSYLNVSATASDARYARNIGGLLPVGTWHIGADYTNKDVQVGVSGRGIVKKPGQVSTGGKAFPCDSYWVFDMNASYKVKKNIRVYANIYNMFDKYYAENTDVIWKTIPGWENLGPNDYWWPMPGRSFIVGAEFSF